MSCGIRALSSRCCWQNWHRAAGSTLTRRASARRPLPLRGRGDIDTDHCPGPRAARIVPPAHHGGHHASARTRPVLCRVTGRAGHGAGPHSACRPARGSRSARSDPRLVLCRTHRVLRHLRQAVRHRCQAQHRPGAGDRLRMEGSDAPRHPHPRRRAVPGRREARRRSGEVQADARPERQGQHAARRGQFDRQHRRDRSAHRAAQPEGAGVAAAGAAHRPRRHHDLAQGDRGGGRQVRPASGLRRTVQFRQRASRRTASC